MGAVVLLLVLLTTQRIVKLPYGVFGKADKYSHLRATINPTNAAIRTVGVIGATLLVFSHLT